MLDIWDAPCYYIEALKSAYAPVAQLDRVTDYESVGQGFESLLAYQNGNLRVSVLFCLLGLEHQNSARMSAAGDGSTEPHICFRPFPGENANESLLAYQNRNLRVSVLFLFIRTRTSKCGAGGSMPRSYRCFLTNCCEPVAYAAGSLCYTRYFPTTGIFDSSTEMAREMVKTTTDTTGTAMMGSKVSTWKPQRWSCSVTRAWTR